ncbi:MAG TPA: hypothetical protein VK304_14790 [Thermoleophilaceae bacterium]|nr:hypothetical protein [Thermoleophilaceae bacterium]
MSSAYDATAWSDLFVAAAGASAALAGLVFVAVSINIEEILTGEGLPTRALETLVRLMGAVVVSVLGLIPQSSTALGIELAVEGALSAVWTVELARRSLPERTQRSWVIGRIAISLCGTLPFLLAGLSLLGERGGGLYWAVGGLLFAIGGGVTTAWVLLVEIRR